MNTSGFVLLITDRRAYLGRYDRRGRAWRRAEVLDWPIQPTAMPRRSRDLDKLACSLVDALGRAHPDGLTVDLVIPSTWCFVRELEFGASWNDEAAAYAFEEYIPVDLEELTCASRGYAGSNRGIIAGLFTEAFAGFLGNLAHAGVRVARITPDLELLPLLAPDGHAHRGVLLCDAMRIAAHSCHGGPQAMFAQLLPAGDQAASMGQIGTVTGALISPRLSAYSLSDNLPELGKVGVEARITPQRESIESLLDAAISAENPVNLRAEALALRGRHEPILDRARKCLGAAIAFFALAGLACWIQDAAYRRACEQLLPCVAASYQAAFPGAPIPSGAALRLRSERIKIEGLTQQGLNREALSGTGLVAFEILHAVTANLPPDIKVEIDEIVLEKNGIRLAGRTTSHQSAGELVRAINRGGGLEVDPPRTKLRRDQTVDFRLAARRTSDAPSD